MFMADISVIVRKMRTQAERNQAHLGIGFPEQLVLMHLKANGSMTQDDLATGIDIDKGAIAKTVAKLEEKGLVSREVNARNKRQKLVSLMPAADATLAAMGDAYTEFQAAMFDGLSPEQINTMVDALALVAQNVSKH